MVAELHSLIRVRKHAVEQKQKFLAELYRQAEALEQQKQTLLDQLETEKQAVKDMAIDFQTYFGAYAQSVKERVEEIDEARKALENRIDQAREDMRSAFAELKKIEMVQENRDKEERNALERKESLELDEIGIEGFRRNESGDL